MTAAAPEHPEYSVEQLAQRTGLTVRTVRFYASEGLLPPPVRRGRSAVYGEHHRLRLDLVRSLQTHGYTLSAIARVLARIPVDASPAEYAVQDAVLAPWLADHTRELDRDELQRRLGRDLDDTDVQFLVTVGALTALPDGRFAAEAGMLAHAAELMALPVPRSVLQESASIIAEHAGAVADGLTELFAHAIWVPYQRGELTHEQVVAILARMRPLALQGLVGSFARAADQAAHRRLER